MSNLYGHAMLIDSGVTRHVSNTHVSRLFDDLVHLIWAGVQEGGRSELNDKNDMEGNRVTLVAPSRCAEWPLDMVMLC